MFDKFLNGCIPVYYSIILIYIKNIPPSIKGGKGELFRREIK